MLNTNTTTRPSAVLSRANLCHALDSLDEVQRSLFELRVFDGLSNKEIADKGFHGMNPKEVRKAFSRAVETLRKTEQVQTALSQKTSG